MADAGVEGAWRFLNRVNRLVEKYVAAGFADSGRRERAAEDARRRSSRVTDDFARFHFNTAIAAIMELVNAIYSAKAVDREAVESVVRLLAPMAPHLSEELWQRLGHGEAQMLATHAWPTFDPSLAAIKRIPYPVQVNGKLRGQLEAAPDATKETIEPAARELASVKPWLDGKEVVKVVFVPGRLISFVVKG